MEGLACVSLNDLQGLREWHILRSCIDRSTGGPRANDMLEDLFLDPRAPTTSLGDDMK